MSQNKEWEERMMDKFCVMFERANKSGDAWEIEMEIFIRQVREEAVAAERGRIITAVENLPVMHTEEDVVEDILHIINKIRIQTYD